VYISFSTTSVESPSERANSSVRSRTGSRISPNPWRTKVAAAASSMACQRRLSSGRTSRKPFTARMAAGFVMGGAGERKPGF
jgi:hypothetical protein